MEVGNRSAGIGGHHGRARLTDEWLTPQEWILALGPFDLDPCAPVVRPWPTAKEHYTIEDDGLRKNWHGLVWCNPPYSRVLEFSKTMACHGNGIMLVFARTETEWFHDFVWGCADSALFLRGRINFCTPDGRKTEKNSGAPSVVVGYGREASRRILNFTLKRVWPGMYVDVGAERRRFCDGR